MLPIAEVFMTEELAKRVTANPDYLREKLAKTPRNNSPCGLCLDIDGPVLMDRPERAYEWIRDAKSLSPKFCSCLSMPLD